MLAGPHALHAPTLQLRCRPQLCAVLKEFKQLSSHGNDEVAKHEGTSDIPLCTASQWHS